MGNCRLIANCNVILTDALQNPLRIRHSKVPHRSYHQIGLIDKPLEFKSPILIVARILLLRQLGPGIGSQERGSLKALTSLALVVKQNSLDRRGLESIQKAWSASGSLTIFAILRNLGRHRQSCFPQTRLQGRQAQGKPQMEGCAEDLCLLPRRAQLLRSLLPALQ